MAWLLQKIKLQGKKFPSTGKFANTQFKKLHMRLPFAPAIPILGVYPEDRAPTVWKYLCTGIRCSCKTKKKVRFLWSGVEWISGTL